MSLKDQLKKNSSENTREMIEQRKEKEKFEKILNEVYDDIVESLEWRSNNGYNSETLYIDRLIRDCIERLEYEDMYDYIDDYDFNYKDRNYDERETIKDNAIAEIKKKYFTYSKYYPWSRSYINNGALIVFKDPDKIINFFKNKLKADDLLSCSTFTKSNEVEIIHGYFENQKTEGFLDYILEGSERRVKRKKVVGKGYTKIKVDIKW